MRDVRSSADKCAPSHDGRIDGRALGEHGDSGSGGHHRAIPADCQQESKSWEESGHKLWVSYFVNLLA